MPFIDVKRSLTRALPKLLLAGIALAAGGSEVRGDSAGAPHFEELRALVPDDGAAVGSRPVFQLAFEGVDPREARRLRFRLVLKRAGSADESYVFDQRERRSGWLVNGDGTVVFRPPRPIADGEYVWRFGAWNGFEWVDAGASREIRVDTVPPAAVEGLRLQHDLAANTIRIAWNPVGLDETGAAEYVTGYHVYRYVENPDLPHVRAFEIGFVEVPEFVDRPPVESGRILYYRIAAEDQAGNVSSRSR